MATSKEDAHIPKGCGWRRAGNGVLMSRAGGVTQRCDVLVPCRHRAIMTSQTRRILCVTSLEYDDITMLLKEVTIQGIVQTHSNGKAASACASAPAQSATALSLPPDMPCPLHLL